MADEYKCGDLFVYTNGDRWELGMVKRKNNRGDGYFCWYSRGDTAASTPIDHMHKLENSGFTHIEDENDKLRELLRYARKELKGAEDELGRNRMNSAATVLDIRMRELGIEMEVG